MMRNYKTLILNADMTAISVVSWQDAITAEFKGTINNVDFYKDDFILCSNGIKLPVPAVSSLKKYKYYDGNKNKFCRRVIFTRDKMTCQYCGNKFSDPTHLTYDHVIPRVRWKCEWGTATNFRNVVTCCYPCNSKKADKTLKEAKMTLLSVPHQPREQYVKGLSPWSTIEPEWIDWLPKVYVELCKVNNKRCII